MKKFITDNIQIFVTLLISITLLSLVGCEREFSEIPYEDTSDLSMMQYLESRDDLSIFTSIVNYVNIDNTLRTAGSYTLFVPNDEALRQFMSSNSINNIEDETLDFWLVYVQYHLIDGKINTFSMTNGALMEPTFFKEKFLVSDISESYEKVKINNLALVIEYNNEQTNGYVHVLDKVLSPPTKSLYETLSATGDFSTMLEIFDETNLDSYLKTGEKITVVIEPDSVLERIGFDKTTIANLEKWAKYHITDEDEYSVDELSADRRYPLQGNAWAVFQDGNNWNFSGDSIPFYGVNNVTFNGIYHVVSDTLSLNSKDIPVSIVYPFYYPGSPFLEPNVTVKPPARIWPNVDSNSMYHTNRARAEGMIKENEHWGPIFAFDAQNVGEYFEFTVPDVPAGTYKLEMINASISSRRADFVPVYEGKVIGPVTDFGARYDRYRYGSRWVRWHTLTPVGTLVVKKRGPVTIRMIVQKLNKTASYKWDLIVDQAILTPVS